MLNRRHIRVKVMQSIYSIDCKPEFNLPQEEKFLKESIAQIYNLYLLMLDLMVEVHAFAKEDAERHANKILATEEERNPNMRFINNEMLHKLSENTLVQDELDKRKLRNWRLDDEYVNVIYKELIASDLYKEYLETESTSFVEDKRFVEQFYTDILAPNDKLYEYVEDYRLTWIDDLPVVNMAVLKRLQKVKPSSPDRSFLPGIRNVLQMSIWYS